MAETGFVPLEDRGVLAIEGPDRAAFLQGLVSNDLRQVAPDRAIYAAFLTPQGKFLHDFLIVELDGALLLDCEAARRDDLMKRLRIYKLRSKVTLEDRTDRYAVAALPGAAAPGRLHLPAEAGAAAPFEGGVAFTDPRSPALGARVLLPRERFPDALRGHGWEPLPLEAYERLRLELGIPAGSRDMEVERATLLESNLDAFNAISWDKGCYMGQELTARTKYRGLVKKRLTPVRIEGPLPAPGTPVTAAGREVGQIRSGFGDRALALLRIEDVAKAEQEGTPLTAGETRVFPPPAA